MRHLERVVGRIPSDVFVARMVPAECSEVRSAAARTGVDSLAEAAAGCRLDARISSNLAFASVVANFSNPVVTPEGDLIAVVFINVLGVNKNMIVVYERFFQL